MENTEQLTFNPPSSGKRVGFGTMLAVTALALVGGAVGGSVTTSLLFRPDSASLLGGRSAAPSGGSLTLQESSAVVDVVNQIGPGVVTIVADIDTPSGRGGATRPTQASGSGVVVDSRGYIVTNAHVIEGARSLTVVFSDGRSQTASVVGTDDPFTDIAVIKVPQDKLETIPLGDSDALTPGQRVVAIGSALGDFRNTVTEGIVSGLHRTWTSGNRVMENLIQTDAAINHGNSGGPLANTQGQVVGINTSVIRQTQGGEPVEGIGFAIPSNTVRLVAGQLIEKGKVTRPYLGVAHQQINPALASFYKLPVKYGAFILQVTANSPAEKAGIKAGDILIGLDSDPLDDAHPFLNVLMKHTPNQKIKLIVSREGKQMELEAVLTERS